MKLLFPASLLAVLLITACNTNPEQVYSGNEKPDTLTQVDENDPDAFEREFFAEADKRELRSVIETDLDTSLLFDIWVYDIEAPHADFVISRQSFRIVDYDGDGNMLYLLIGDQLTVLCPDKVKQGKITSVTKDTLFLQWDYLDEPAPYVRWNDYN